MKKLLKALFTILFLISVTTPLFTVESKNTAPKESYKINFKDVPLVEYVRFVSKICDTNFLYDEKDLNFKVTVVSEDPTTPENVMAALLQILRVYGFSILEQGANLVIHKNEDVKQIAPLVDASFEPASSPPIVTSVFTLHYGKPETIANILKSMISKQAALEISPETKQIIITDIASNIKKISQLIEKIESPDLQFHIYSYLPKNSPAEALIDLSLKVLTPFIENTHFIMIPDQGTIIIASSQKLIDKAIAILKKLDSTPISNIFIYKPKQKSPKQMEKALKELADSLQNSGFLDQVMLDTLRAPADFKEAGALIFRVSKENLGRLEEFLATIDGTDESVNYFYYIPKYLSKEELLSKIREMVKHFKEIKLQDQPLVAALENVKTSKNYSALLFSGTPYSLKEVEKLLGQIDITGDISSKENFFIYQIQHVAKESLDNYLKNIAANLQGSTEEASLKTSINERKWLADSNSFMFSGNPRVLEKIKAILTKFDIPEDKKPDTKESFFIFQVKGQDKENFVTSLKNIAANLKPSQGDLKESIQNMKWLEDSNSLFFSGKEKALSQLKELLSNKEIFASRENILTFRSKNHTKDQIENFLNGLLLNLKDIKGEDNLKQAIKNMKWVSDSSSFIFSGKEDVLAKLQEILSQFDLSKSSDSSTYLLYKLKHISGSIIEDDLDNFAESIKSKKLGKQSLIEVINNIKWIKETNSLLLTGDVKAVTEVEELIAKFDIQRSGLKAHQKDEFLIYKPIHVDPQRFEKSIKAIKEHFEKSELADPHLINTLGSMRYVDVNNSFVFTGSKESLKKIKDLLPTIDTVSKDAVKAGIQKLGQASFLVFKIKGDPQSLQNSIKSLLDDLVKSKNSDEAFVAALRSMKYVKETNSLLFTGNEQALEKVQQLMESLQGAVPVSKSGSFYIYKPLHLSGPALEAVLQDFSEHLKATGFESEDLYKTINSAKWVEKTNSMIFTGSKKSIDEIKGLLASFDTTDKEGISNEPPIQPIDNLSFLVYKLQYHKGSEIQTALKQIGKNLIAQKAQVEQGLLNAIDSIQWIEVTNSLLCSGPQDTVERMKDLIKNLDMPLKQVFIEVLIIETELSNLLNFGLDWGSKMKYRNKLAGSISNFPNSSDTTFPPNGNNFPNVFNNVGNVNTPNPATGLPFQKGFDFGVIGDIILHKGKSFISLGSLVNALQDDEETSVVMTPKIIAQDGKTSKIFSGKNVPYTGGITTNTQGTTTTQNTTYEYRDIGLNLVITPVLGNSDTVTLTIDLERTTQLTDVTGVSTSTVGSITTAKTDMSTTVHMPNKKFLILSGLVNDTKERRRTGLPCLGGLPLIGAAFATNNKLDTKNNLVIFIRPHIINSYKDMTTITENQEDYFREYSGAPTLERDFDESIDMLKTYEDEE